MEAIQVSSLEKILKDTDINGIDEFKTFSALRNERFAYEIVVNNSSDECKNIKVEIESNLKDIIDIKRIGYVYVNRVSGIEEPGLTDYVITEKGYVPDALLPIDNDMLELPPNENTSLLVTVNADKFIADAGEYDIAVKLIAEDEVTEKHFLLNIIDALLPPQTLTYTDWFHCDAIALMHNVNVFSEKFWDITEKYMLEASRLGVNMILTPIFTPPLDTEIGAERLTVQLIDIEKNGDDYEFEFSKLYRWIALAEKCGMKYFEMAHLFTQWGAKFTPKIVVKVNGKEEKLFGWHIEATDERYEHFLSQFLPALVNALKRTGVADRTFFHISDEPGGEAIEQYVKCRRIVEKYIDGLAITDALSDPDFYERGLITHPVPGTESVKKFMKFDIKDRWAYYCCAQCNNLSNRFTAMRGWLTRMIGCQLYKYDIHGFLHWGFNHYFSILSKEPVNPYEKTEYPMFPTGDAFIVYPYKDGAVGSLRMQQFYDALQDQRALDLLEKLIGREASIALIEIEAGGKITFESYPHNENFILNWRREANEKIKEYSKAE